MMQLVFADAGDAGGARDRVIASIRSATRFEQSSQVVDRCADAVLEGRDLRQRVAGMAGRQELGGDYAQVTPELLKSGDKDVQLLELTYIELDRIEQCNDVARLRREQRKVRV
jgi:hypothetical protein